MWRKHNCADRVMILSGGSKVPKYECAGCKCLLEKPVKTVDSVGFAYSTPSHYCGKCAPAYDKIEHGEYYRMMRCHYDGTLWVDPMEHLKNAKKSK